jgi:hypothetical protein
MKRVDESPVSNQPIMPRGQKMLFRNEKKRGDCIAALTLRSFLSSHMNNPDRDSSEASDGVEDHEEQLRLFRKRNSAVRGRQAMNRK